MTNNAVGRCWSCGQEFDESLVRREARCPSCDKAIHACRNCRFYKPGRSNDCLEPIADFVSNKQDANFCGYFAPDRAAYRGAAGDEAALLNAAEALFKS